MTNVLKLINGQTKTDLAHQIVKNPSVNGAFKEVVAKASAGMNSKQSNESSYLEKQVKRPMEREVDSAPQRKHDDSAHNDNSDRGVDISQQQGDKYAVVELSVGLAEEFNEVVEEELIAEEIIAPEIVVNPAVVASLPLSDPNLAEIVIETAYHTEDEEVVSSEKELPLVSAEKVEEEERGSTEREEVIEESENKAVQVSQMQVATVAVKDIEIEPVVSLGEQALKVVGEKVPQGGFAEIKVDDEVVVKTYEVNEQISDNEVPVKPLAKGSEEVVLEHNVGRESLQVSNTVIKKDVTLSDGDLGEDVRPILSPIEKLESRIKVASNKDVSSSEDLKKAILSDISRVLATNSEDPLNEQFDFLSKPKDLDNKVLNESNLPSIEEVDFGGILKFEQGKLSLSFEGAQNKLLENIPHRAEQISLSIKEAISHGKSEISVSLYPEALGQVDVKLEFLKVGSEQIITSIKILADRPETLKLLGDGIEYLKSSIKEVVKSSDNASLSLDLRQGQNSEGSSKEAREQHDTLLQRIEYSDDLADGDVVTRQYQARYSVNNDDKVDIRA